MRSFRWLPPSGGRRRRAALAAAIALTGPLVWLRCGPIPARLLEAADAPSTVVVDRHGDVLYEALSPDGMRVDEHGNVILTVGRE